jgi:NADH-quinone oxidoreductase subunit C
MGVNESPNSGSGLSGPLKRIVEEFPGDILETATAHGDDVALVSPGALHRIMEFLRGEPALAFTMLLDITAVDFLGREPRFEVVYHLMSLAHNRRLRIKVGVPGESPSLQTLSDVWPSANWLEREVWDMFGIRFTGHPDLKRILLYPEFQGHPLRKDYPIRRRQPLIGPKN